MKVCGLMFWLYGLVVLALVSVSPLIAQDRGLDAAEEIGPYLNGVFPSKAPGSTLQWDVVDAFPNLTFVEPLALVPVPRDGSSPDRLVLATCEGRFFLFENDPNTSAKTEILDIVDQVDDSSKDTGFYCIAFHPRFADPSGTYRFLYAFYRYTPVPGGSGGPAYMRLSRFTVPNNWIIDPQSELVLIQQYDRHYWHSGGGLAFGNDGFLYITVGDEGAANDSYGSMRGLDNGLFGGVLRIDVDQDPTRSHPIRRQPLGADPPQGWPPTFTANYGIPDDNPWIDPSGDTLEEFYAYGLRSPHRMTYDSLTNEFWVGDVGQGRREEINRIVRGGNFQWPYREGDRDTGTDSGTENIGTQQPPFWTYNRSSGSCVIGGLIYRGTEFAQDLYGLYLCSDHISSRLWVLDPAVPGVPEYIGQVPANGHGANIVSFAQDHDGELLMLKWNGLHADGGQILKLAQNEAVPEPPQSLSQLGVFENLQTLETIDGIHPYGVQAPLYSDRAIKKRWIAVPNDGDHDDASETIQFSADAHWGFPEGTVFIKHFDLPMSESDPTLLRRLETRFFIMGEGGRAYGLTYRWNQSGTDAFLIDEREDLEYEVETDSGPEAYTWTFPSRSDCRVCHNDNAGQVLGVRTHQINGDFMYPDTGVMDNQLRSWNHIGLFDPPIAEQDFSSFLKAYGLEDETASLEDRIRSYLDSNCALCHQPGGNVTATFDARYTTPMMAQDLLHGQIVGDTSPPGARVSEAQDVANSMLHFRMSVNGDQQMPPIGRNRVDTRGQVKSRLGSSSKQWSKIEGPIASSDSSRTRKSTGAHCHHGRVQRPGSERRSHLARGIQPSLCEQ